MQKVDEGILDLLDGDTHMVDAGILDLLGGGGGGGDRPKRPSNGGQRILSKRLADERKIARAKKRRRRTDLEADERELQAAKQNTQNVGWYKVERKLSAANQKGKSLRRARHQSCSEVLDEMEVTTRDVWPKPVPSQPPAPEPEGPSIAWVEEHIASTEGPVEEDTADPKRIFLDTDLPEEIKRIARANNGSAPVEPEARKVPRLDQIVPIQERAIMDRGRGRIILQQAQDPHARRVAVSKNYLLQHHGANSAPITPILERYFLEYNNPNKTRLFNVQYPDGHAEQRTLPHFVDSLSSTPCHKQIILHRADEEQRLLRTAVVAWKEKSCGNANDCQGQNFIDYPCCLVAFSTPDEHATYLETGEWPHYKQDPTSRLCLLCIRDYIKEANSGARASMASMSNRYHRLMMIQNIVDQEGEYPMEACLYNSGAYQGLPGPVVSYHVNDYAAVEGWVDVNGERERIIRVLQDQGIAQVGGGSDSHFCQGSPQ